MNAFLEYATAGAFFISLSKPQLEMIWRMYHRRRYWFAHKLSFATWRALADRGIVSGSGDSRGLTQEGRALASFLNKIGAFDQFDVVWQDKTACA